MIINLNPLYRSVQRIKKNFMITTSHDHIVSNVPEKNSCSPYPEEVNLDQSCDFSDMKQAENQISPPSDVFAKLKTFDLTFLTGMSMGVILLLSVQKIIEVITGPGGLKGYLMRATMNLLLKQPEKKTKLNELNSNTYDRGLNKTKNISTKFLGSYDSWQPTIIHELLCKPHLVNLIHPCLPKPMRTMNFLKWMLLTPEIRIKIKENILVYISTKPNLSAPRKLYSKVKEEIIETNDQKHSRNTTNKIIVELSSEPDSVILLKDPCMRKALIEASYNLNNVRNHLEDHNFTLNLIKLQHAIKKKF